MTPIFDLTRCNLSEARVGFSNKRDSSANDWTVNFKAAELTSANLSNAKFNGADLSNANFGSAHLNNTDLSNANLSEANLRASRFRRYRNGQLFVVGGRYGKPADLSGAILYRANLSGAEITQEQWEKAKTLESATMPNGSEQPLGEYIPQYY